MPASIKPKKRPVIQKGNGFVYNSATFADEHKVPNFFTVEEPEELLKRLNPFVFNGRKFITFDTETHPVHPNSHLATATQVRRWVGSGKTAVAQDLPFCISVCDGYNAYTLFDDPPFDKFKRLSTLFEDPTIEKIAHNTKYDMHMFANAGLRIVGRLHDTVVLAKLADENRSSFKLKDLAASLPYGMVKFEMMVDTYKQINKIGSYKQIPRELLAEYANADVWNAFVVFMDEYPKIERDELVDLYDNECELMVALYAQERYGMRIDSTYETELKSELQKLTDDAERDIYAEAGRMFNINSGPQLYSVLMELGTDPSLIGRTEKGNPNLDKDALNLLAEKYDVSIVKKILEFRKYEKLLSTYANGLYDQRDADFKVHSSINQTEATTGRMSITKPALQTLPKKDKRIRKAFIPSDGFDLWFMDLDQVEYRLFAHYARSHGLLEAIAAGHDVHAATAAIIFCKPLEEVTDDERAKAKTTNFALIYGQGNDHTAVMLKMTMTETVAFKANYFAQIPEAKPFIMSVHNVIKARGFVKNFFGRRRRLDHNDCYKAPNALIQGCAADYIKHKLVDMYKYTKYNGLQSRAINIVHDEVVLEIHQSEAHEAATFRWLLSDFNSFRCPITAGVEKGMPSWGQKEEQPDVGFHEPEDKGYLTYNVYDGSVFDIYREV